MLKLNLVRLLSFLMISLSACNNGMRQSVSDDTQNLIIEIECQPTDTAGPSHPSHLKKLPSKKLICWDVDDTLVNGHLHHYLYSEGMPPITDPSRLIVNGIVQAPDVEHHVRAPRNVLSNIVQCCLPCLKYQREQVIQEAQAYLDRMGLKHPTQLAQAFRDCLDEGCAIAITSFTLYPDVVRVILERLGLTEEDLAKIDVICGGIAADKMAHIKKAMQLASITDLKSVALVDDSTENIQAARKQGIIAIQVHGGNYDGYFQEINEFLHS